METTLGATSRMRAANPVDKASKTEEADESDIGKAPLPPKMRLMGTAAQLARWSGRPLRPRGRCFSARVEAPISAGSARSEVRFDSAGACFCPLAHVGSRVRRDSPQSPAAQSKPGPSLLRAGGE